MSKKSTQTHSIRGVIFKVNEVVEVREVTGETWRARILTFKKDSHQVIVRDIRRTEFGGMLWRAENLVYKSEQKSSGHLKAY